MKKNNNVNIFIYLYIIIYIKYFITYFNNSKLFIIVIIIIN